MVSIVGALVPLHSGTCAVKALGVDGAMRVSDTCVFAIFIAPVDRESRGQVFVVIRTMK